MFLIRYMGWLIIFLLLLALMDWFLFYTEIW